MRSNNRLLYFIAIAALGLGIYNTLGGPILSKVSAQVVDAYLSRRVDQVEQRFYMLESRLNRLESEGTRRNMTTLPAATNDVELQFLRTQVESLRSRVGELECGVLRLDERTLPAPRRMAARRAEPCRKDPGSVVELSARPN